MAEIKSALCPIWGKPAAEKTKPFCSQRCANVDLGRWFGEGYRVPDTSISDEEEFPSSDEEES